ncbi:MAG: sugar ABC transporter permease, partial [Burkholderiales bacterium]|nr:sugar ABC transporter permease [Anaerolineae bacterium]
MANVIVPDNHNSPFERIKREIKHGSSWLYLLPALVFFIGYQVYPIIRVFVLSFTDYRLLAADEAQFIGLQNYANAVVDPVVHQGLLRAGYFTLLFLPGTIFVPLFVAILVDRVKNQRIASLYKIILLIPAVIPGPMIFVLWKWLYDFEIGPINTFLIEGLHLFNYRNAPQWLGKSNLAIPAIAIMEVWWGIGYHTIFFLAGLATIPKEMIDAARVDGANEWQLFWRITLPRLRAIMLILVVLRFGSAMAVIDEYLIFGSFDRTLPTYTWTVYMWHLAFQLGDRLQGYAAAIGWIGAGVMLVVVALLFYIFRN